METYQSRSHQRNISDAFKWIVNPTVGLIDEHLLNGLIMLFRIDEFGASKLLSNFEFIIVDIDANDTASTRLFASQYGS